MAAAFLSFFRKTFPWKQGEKKTGPCVIKIKLRKTNEFTKNKGNKFSHYAKKKKTPSLLTFQLKNLLKSLLKNKKILIISVQEIQRKNDQDNLGGNKKKNLKNSLPNLN